MFYTNYGALKRFEKCAFKRIFRGFSVFLIKPKKMTPLPLDFEGCYINNAVTQRFEKCTYKRDFREFSAFLMKIIWPQNFLESDRI